MVIDNQKKGIPCGWLPQGSFFATGYVASGWCHNGGCFYRPSLCRINVPRILPSTLVSRESITSPMVIVTTSLPCRIGLVGPWQLQYSTTDDKNPTAPGKRSGIFRCDRSCRALGWCHNDGCLYKNMRLNTSAASPRRGCRAAHGTSSRCGAPQISRARQASQRCARPRAVSPHPLPR